MARSTPHSAAEEASRKLWRQAGMGATLASEIIAAMGLGWLADKVFGTQPILLIIFTTSGVVGGMALFIRGVLKETRAAGREASRVAEHLRESDPDRDERGTTGNEE